MRKRFLSALLALCIVLSLLPLTALAEELASGNCGDAGSDVTWKLDSDGKLTISGTGDMANYNWSTAFFPPWYDQRERIRTVVIENGVTYIGDYAFSSCSNLTSITIPDSVTSIGSHAFFYCSSLTSITIPNSVTSIEDRAFWCCDGLTEITIPGSVTSIGYGAFSECKNLTTITILEGLTSIEDWMFIRCYSLTSITIPDSVTSIGDSVFSSCSSLASITIPDRVTSIGVGAFSECSSLTSITIPDGVSSIGNSAFSECSSLTSITIPDGVTSIGDHAFRECSNLTSITIPDSVTSIGNAVFSSCTSLTSITIPDGVSSIGSGAFSGCSSLTSITFPDSVSSIDCYCAFSGCSSLISITIPDGATSIGSYAFKDCSNLTSITIPDSVTSIEDYAFYNCSSLTNVTVPDSVTSIGYNAFWYCSNLTDVYYGGSKTQWLKAGGPDRIYGYGTATTIHYGLTVTYDANGGTGEMASVKIVEGQTYNLPSCGFTAPKNQKFKTWRIGQTEYAPGDAYLFSEDTTVTAIWEDVEKEPSPTVSDKIKDQLDGILDSAVDEIQNLLENLDKEEIKNAIDAVVDEIFDRIEELEKRIGGSAEIDVAAELGFAETDVKIVGAKLNTGYEENVRLEIRPPEDSEIVIPNQNRATTFRFSMKLLEGENNNIVNLQVPTRITLPIPNVTTRPKNLAIWNKHGGELVPVPITTQPFKENNQWYVSFKVSGFSDFIMSYEEGTDNPAPGSSGGGSSKPSIKPGVETTPSAPTTTPGDGVAGFNDVAAGAWYADSVKYVVEKGLFDGVGSGSFAPDANMTRAMMWTVLARYMGVDTNSDSNWYEVAQAWAVEKGISDGTMANGNVTREQFVTMLWRLSGEPVVENSASFTDSGSVSGYARAAVDWAVNQGIISGYSDGSFGPQRNATRAEVAKMLTVFCTNAESQN